MRKAEAFSHGGVRVQGIDDTPQRRMSESPGFPELALVFSARIRSHACTKMGQLFVIAVLLLVDDGCPAHSCTVTINLWLEVHPISTIHTMTNLTI